LVTTAQFYLCKLCTTNYPTPNYFEMNLRCKLGLLDTLNLLLTFFNINIYLPDFKVSTYRAFIYDNYMPNYFIFSSSQNRAILNFSGGGVFGYTTMRLATFY